MRSELAYMAARAHLEDLHREAATQRLAAQAPGGPRRLTVVFAGLRRLVTRRASERVAADGVSASSVAVQGAARDGGRQPASALLGAASRVGAEGL